MWWVYLTFVLTLTSLLDMSYPVQSFSGSILLALIGWLNIVIKLRPGIVYITLAGFHVVAFFVSILVTVDSLVSVDIRAITTVFKQLVHFVYLVFMLRSIPLCFCNMRHGPIVPLLMLSGNLKAILVNLCQCAKKSLLWQYVHILLCLWILNK